MKTFAAAFFKKQTQFRTRTVIFAFNNTARYA